METILLIIMIAGVVIGLRGLSRFDSENDETDYHDKYLGA